MLIHTRIRILELGYLWGFFTFRVKEFLDAIGCQIIKFLVISYKFQDPTNLKKKLFSLNLSY